MFEFLPSCLSSLGQVPSLLIVPDNSDPWLTQSKQDDLSSTDLQVSTCLIQNVAPLDSQIGEWPKKIVPAVLEEAVFGGPWAHSYALIDAARHENLLTRLEERELPGSCLFEGAAAERVAEVSPWLLEISDDDRLTRNLFTAPIGTDHIWDATRCLFLRSNQPIIEVRRNLRKMTQIRDERGRWLFFRFWDPLFARYLLCYGSNAFRLRLLRTGPVMMRGSDDSDFQIWSLPAGTDQIPRSPFQLEPEDLRALKLARLDDFVCRILTWLRSSYGGLPNGMDERRFALELTMHARERIGLRTERQISDYIAASWLLRMPAERRLDMRPVSHEIPQATLERVHDMAHQIFKGTS